MIPTIGIMVGCYIITRMTSVLARRGDRKEEAIVEIFAALTIAITAFAILSLFGAGASNGTP